jgi:hypothetical protein
MKGARVNLRGERGEISLVQLLVATSLMLGVLTATLTVFQAGARNNAEANARNDSQDTARTGLDRMARELRNLASPTPEQPQAVDKATAFDMVFQTVDAVGPNAGLNAANVERVRYCLAGTANAAVLYRQDQRWTTQAAPAVPTTTACPSTDTQWTQTRRVAQSITNQRDSLNRALFTFDSAVATDVTSVHVQLYVDIDPVRPPVETNLSTGVFLRNQNRHPSSSFTADTSVPGKIVLNGSASSDPEGEPLTYVWYDGASKVGDGIRFDYAVTRNTSHAMQLKVYDPAGLEGVAAAQTVVAP